MQTDRKEKLCDKKGLEGIKQKKVMNVQEEKKNEKGKPCKLARMICDHEDLELHPVADTCSVSM